MAAAMIAMRRRGATARLAPSVLLLLTMTGQSAGAVLSSAMRLPAPLSTATSCGPLLARGTAAIRMGRTSRLGAAVMAVNFAEFSVLESEVRAYLATLDDTAINDPDAPSPLAYTELQAAGRVDLVEGCMQHGGYLAVSRKLGVRVQASVLAPQVAQKPLFDYDDDKADTGAGVMLSGAAKEDKMAADLIRLAAKSSEPAAPVVAPKAPVGDRLTPLKAPAAAAAAGDGEQDKGPLYGLGRYIRLNGLQRANAGLLAVLLAAGFGQSSAEALDPGLVGTVQLAATVLCVAHLLIASYGAFVAATAADGKQNAGLWFVKLAITGVGGLLELTSRE